MTTELPRTQVITQRRFGGPEVLEIEERPLPRPAPGEVLVRVRAAAVNHLDLLVRSGTVPLYGEPPFTLGSDVSGVVEAVGVARQFGAPAGDVHKGLVEFGEAGLAARPDSAATK